MSEENVEIVRRLIVDGGDSARLLRDDATWTRWRAEIEPLLDPDWTTAWIADGQPWLEATGPDDARRRWLDWLEPWERYEPQVEKIVAVDNKVTRAEHYADHAEALEAVGLPEP
jgi:hypothetical protein